eukprot:1156625-Pelagomonas_calceolata.AAC.3
MSDAAQRICANCRVRACACACGGQRICANCRACACGQAPFQNAWKSASDFTYSPITGAFFEIRPWGMMASQAALLCPTYMMLPVLLQGWQQRKLCPSKDAAILKLHASLQTYGLTTVSNKPFTRTACSKGMSQRPRLHCSASRGLALMQKPIMTDGLLHRNPGVRALHQSCVAPRALNELLRALRHLQQTMHMA